MAKTTPRIQHNQLYIDGLAFPVCRVGSPKWFTWLETAVSFRYYSQQRLPVAHSYSRTIRPISVRKEKRRRGYLWYAYLRSHGCLHKRYVGKSVALTVEKLDEIALTLNQIW
ncbi:MAG: hypothetical protein M5U34_45040 [Chloroflexi bacterium]|nr:hypothetical protein [Chloroflexota bacterium]